MKTLTITLSDSRPVKINDEEWPAIAVVSDWSGGQIECQANTQWVLRVRRHADGRTIVYGWQDAGPGGQYVGTRNPRAGYLLTAEATEDEVIRAIRRVAGAINRDELGSDCIADLPAETI